jgi:hypothetical protein
MTSLFISKEEAERIHRLGLLRGLIESLNVTGDCLELNPADGTGGTLSKVAAEYAPLMNMGFCWSPKHNVARYGDWHQLGACAMFFHLTESDAANLFGFSQVSIPRAISRDAMLENIRLLLADKAAKPYVEMVLPIAA